MHRFKLEQSASPKHALSAEQQEVARHESQETFPLLKAHVLPASYPGYCGGYCGGVTGGVEGGVAGGLPLEGGAGVAGRVLGGRPVATSFSGTTVLGPWRCGRLLFSSSELVSDPMLGEQAAAAPRRAAAATIHTFFARDKATSGGSLAARVVPGVSKPRSPRFWAVTEHCPPRTPRFVIPKTQSIALWVGTLPSRSRGTGSISGRSGALRHRAGCRHRARCRS